jgi:ribosomal protein S6--L-glutamate ligase
MKIAILSREPKCYSTRRLLEAARKRGHSVKVLNTYDFTISLEEEYPDLYYRNKPVAPYDAVIPRIGASTTAYGLAVVRQFEQMDAFCLNSSLGIANAADKLRSLQMLSRHNIGIPPTEFARRKADVIPAIHRTGGAPVVLKLLEGTQGVGVILADTIEIAEAIVETLQVAKQSVLIQKFVSESKGKDIRAFVIGDKVVAAMRRVAQGQEFRSNVHRGAVTEPVILDSVYEETAVRAAQISGLRVAGVDLLEAKDGPQVMEVNSSPGLEGIEEASGIDIAGLILEYIEDQVSFPDMDLRQRLTLSKGHGVAEIPVPKKSSLIGKTIGELCFEEKDILVLTLHRHHKVIPYPKPSRELEEGDRLVCFGKLEEMRSFIPPKQKRRRSRK